MSDATDSIADQLTVNSPEPNQLSSQYLPWLGLLCILAAYICCIVRLHPTHFFGLTEDDSIYFSSAREIAQGRGYTLANVPGTPPAAKYPILYPWMLSWVWWLNPSFPANLSWAVALNVAFGMMFLTLAFIFLRRLKGLTDRAALIVTAVCAVHPVILIFSGALMSDIPFAALVLASTVLASKAIEQQQGMKSTVFCALLSGLSILLRTLGVPVAFGICVAVAVRGGWRKTVAFAAILVPFLSAFAGSSFLHKPPAAPLAASPCADSWRMTWLYYTSYTGYWKADVLNHHVFWQTLKNNAGYMLLQPGTYLVETSIIRRGVIAFILLVLVSAIALRGVLRQAQAGGWQPIHFALAFYLLPVLVWDYADRERFLIPFMPLIGAGIWVEIRNIVDQARKSIRKKSLIPGGVATVFCGSIACFLLFITGLSWWHGFGQIAQRSDARAAILGEKREAYEWLRQNTPANARVLAYEDATSFLYSGRQAMRPTIFSPAGGIRPEILDSELACLTSSAKPIGANFWIVSDDDFGFEWEPASSLGKAREAAMTGAFQPLFRSQQGRVRVYRLDSEGALALSRMMREIDSAPGNKN